MEDANNAKTFTPNLLIVDDVPANLKVLSAILKEDAYKIRPVLSGELALQVAEQEKPDLILLDIMMPDMNGYEVANHLKANPGLKDIPIIFISALNDTQDIVQAFIAGGVDYITKPFQSEEVRARIATQLKISRQTRELQQLNADKDKLFTIIAHDLRGPIGNLKQILDMILCKKDLDENLKNKLLHQLNVSAKTTYTLLENLLLWAQSQINAVHTESQHFALCPLVQENIDLLKPQADQKQIQLRSNVEFSLSVFADQNSINTVVRNLLSNAIKFTPAQGSITVSASDLGEVVEVKVQDNGVGMPADVADRLFKANTFHTSYGTNNEKGSGLGLVLVKDFVERNGGSIRVESVVNEGSTFVFTVPKEGL